METNNLTSSSEQCVQYIRQTLQEYPGHQAESDRRVSDESLRAYLSRAVNTLTLQFGSLRVWLERHPVNGLREQAVDVEQNIEMLLDKIQTAPYAYAPFFAASRVPQEIQERVLREDLELVLAVRRVNLLIEPTLKPDSDFGQVLNDIADAVRNLDDRLESRISAIMEFQG